MSRRQFWRRAATAATIATLWWGGLTAARAAPPADDPAAEAPAAEVPATPKSRKAVSEKSRTAKRGSAGAGEAKLTPRQEQWLDGQVLPAYALGNYPAVVTLIRDFLPKSTVAVRETVDRELAERHAPSLDSLLAGARLDALRSGAARALPPPSAQELPLLDREYRRQVEALLDEARAKPIFDDPLPAPESLTEYRDLLWSAHILNNQLRNVAFLTKQAEAILAAAPASRGKKEQVAEEAAARSAPFVAARETAAQLHRDMSERAVELRVRRIDRALEVLETSRDMKERFLAAYAIGVDGDQVSSILKNRTAPFARETLNDPQLAGQVDSQLERAKLLAGDLIVKSRQLFAGLHWWRRGRYGRGPEHFGLVKFKAALDNPQANIALVMPLDAPLPTDPQQPGGGSPDYDRRHHAWWSWETVQFTGGIADSSRSSSSYSYVTVDKNRPLGHFDGNIRGRFY